MATAVSATDVKSLRERTGAGMMDCKGALEEAGGDLEKAVEILRVKGQADAAKRGGREAGEGAIASYVHATGKIGVLVEVLCETDFVARNEEFKEFAREIALQIAAANPQYVSIEEIPEDAKEAERRILEQQVDPDKPAEIQAKMVEGRLSKWVKEVALLEQEHVNADKHGGKTIEELRAETAAKMGENIVISRIARFEIGAE